MTCVFKEWLDTRGLSARKFSRMSKVSYVTIYKALRGETVRIDTAKKIRRATKKEVTLQDLGIVVKKIS